MTRVACIAVLLALTGCSSVGGHCSGEFDYQKAETLPPAQKVEGLKQPDSASALRIPPPPANPVPFAETYPDPKDPGDKLVRCLDVPPRLPDEPAAPPPAKS